MHLLYSRRRLALLAPTLAVSLALTAPLVAIAQSDSYNPIASDGTGVARISVIQGSVGIERGDSAGSLAAVVNAPILGGDYVTTGNTSRTEIQFDGSSQVRLGQDAQLRFTHIDQSNRTVQLAQGTLELRLLQSTDGNNEVDTPSISIKPRARGAYRITVTRDGQTIVTARSGQAEIDTPQGLQTVQSGTTLIATGAASSPSIQNVDPVAYDDFDGFNSERDRIHSRALADARFVNTDIGGVDDLDGYGRWVSDGSYGHVWVPASVRSDWAPYRDGRWVWEDGYGWTWVASEPWGWAPYHYGSWYHSPDYGWCWYPPQPRVYTPWRPALVAFIGFGAEIGVSLGFGGGASFGNVGWVPLAPHEDYHPWWGNRYGNDNGGGRDNPTIINNITNNTITNVTNNTTVNNVNVYRNVRYNGVSSVTSQRFLQGNFVHNTPVALNQLQRAQVFHSAVPIIPSASNLRFANTAERAPIAVRPALSQHAFAGNANVVRRTSFIDQRVALASVTHAPITPLHFKDARTTPLVEQQIVRPVINRVGEHHTGDTRNASVAPLPHIVRPAFETSGEATTVTTRPTTAIAHPTAPSDPWARFNESRSIETEHHVSVPAATTGSRNGYEANTTGHAPALAPPTRLAPIVEPYHAPAAVAPDRTSQRLQPDGTVLSPNMAHSHAAGESMTATPHNYTQPHGIRPRIPVEHRAPVEFRAPIEKHAPVEYHTPAERHAPAEHEKSQSVPPETHTVRPPGRGRR